MTKKLNEQIKEFKKGDQKQFIFIMERFLPLSKRYARLLYKDEREDMLSEMNLAILEAIHKIEYLNNEGQCVVFINTAMKNRFLELYRKSKNKSEHEQYIETDQDFCSIANDFKEVEFKIVFNNLLTNYNDKQKQILHSIVIENRPNTEVAVKHKVSRQYTNRIKNKLCNEMKKIYLENRR